MARLDRVKNITGLVEFYGKNPRLRELVNLVVVAGDHGKESKDKEEQAEFKKMYSLIEQYNLNGQIRWISAQMNRVRNGELYRYIADTKGAFVQVNCKAKIYLRRPVDNCYTRLGHIQGKFSIFRSYLNQTPK